MNNYNYRKLRGRIREKCGTQRVFAHKINRSNTHVSNLLNNYSQFDQEDIDKSIDILEIPREEIGSYFFTKEVHKSGTA